MAISKRKADDRATALSRAVDQFCAAVQTAITAGLDDAAVTYRVRRVTKLAQGQLAARRRKQWKERSDALWATQHLKPTPSSPSDEAMRQTWQAQAQAQQERFRQSQEQAAERERQRRAQCEAGQQIINAGYRAMAAKMHPDTGGSTAAMQVLNRAKDHLKRMA